ncbi:MAG: hypothetical protein OXT65_12485 [Alphaproteobacteria bacterium]|nr:hypothetical protein [Alphaproteobacteria bacterium]
MRSATLKPAIENMDKALSRLEAALDKQVSRMKKAAVEPQLDLNAVRENPTVNKKIAARLDQTIHRLETLLSEEQAHG